MAIDPNIALSIKPIQLTNPLEQYMQVQQIQQAKNQSRLADLMYGEKQREVSEGARLNEIYKGAVADDGSLDRTKLYSGVASAGLGSRLPGLQKTFAEADAKQADLGKTKAETHAKEVEAAHKAFDIAGQAFGYVRANPTLDNALAAIDYLGIQPGLYKPEQLESWRQQVRSDPSKIQSLADQAFRASLAAKDQLPKIDTRNLGGTTETFSVDPVTGKSTVVNRATNTVSPDAQLQANTSRANNAATVGASMANAAAVHDQAQATRDAASIQTKFNNEQGLRKEFEGLPEVKSYKQAYPSYAAIKDAASRSTPQSDINIVYGLAKLYDPNSVVREGEYATVANSPSIPEKVKGYAQYLAGGGKLSEGTKKQILAEAESRMQSYGNEVRKARASYEGIARKSGMDPAGVFSDMGDFGAPAAPKSPNPGGAAPNTNAKGWTLHVDANGNKAYVSPDGKSWEGVQ